MRFLSPLLLPLGHLPLSEQRRAAIIVSRVRMVAGAFAFLTPTWILVDWLIYTWPLWGLLAALRILATLSFTLIAINCRPTGDIDRARLLLWAVMLVPIFFFMLSIPMMGRFEISGVAEVVSMGYVFLPFVIMAGLSMFPITALEGIGFAVPIVLVMLGVGWYGAILVPFNSFLGAIWLLALIGGVSTFAGMSQLHFMCQLVRQSSLDPLTETYNRGAGMELLKIQFAAAQRSGTPLAVAFLDLDHFKSINDNYGHEEGDNILRQAAEHLRQAMRHSDVLVRWGGEEFVIVMPNTIHDYALVPMQRLLDKGFGRRPDEQRLTASIGLAERQKDRVDSWSELVELADRRLYQAKQSGRNRLVGANDVEAVPRPLNEAGELEETATVLPLVAGELDRGEGKAPEPAQV